MKAPTKTISADLILLHAPSVFDFRDRDDMVFAYLSDSDSVNITSIYEMYPLGFLSIKGWLKERGFSVEIVNLASLMLMYPNLNVDRLLARLDTEVFGLDLHWMAQCHGSIEVAKRIKTIHPDALTIFGGISATYFAEELIRYSSVDVVVQGYDTLEPLSQLMKAAKRGGRDFRHVPNLLLKDGDGEVVRTGFSHKPVANYNDVAVDWSCYAEAKSQPMSSRLIMTLPNTGCAMDCPWCGGSRTAFRRIMGTDRSLVFKDHRRIMEELHTIGDAAKSTTIYALQCYSEPKKRLYEYLEGIKEEGYHSVSFEQYHLPDEETLKRMGQSTQAYVMLSPESHDLEISTLAGRGSYSMEEMEAWIPKAFDAGIKGVMVWFFIGMPRQTPRSVLETVDYCEALLKKFRGKPIVPLICPMVPFLDPGSRFFEEPKEHGYRVFFKTLEQHRQASVKPLWWQRLNYETEWMSRREMQEVTYQAVARLTKIKRDLGVLPSSVSSTVLNSIKETRSLLSRVERSLEVDGGLSPSLREQVRAYNRKTLSSSSDQIVPTQRPFGGRWFDDSTVPSSMIEDLIK